VQELYRLLLGRAADAGGLAYWTGFLRGGGTRGDAVREIWNSPEHLGRQVDGFYAAYLHRAADPQGRAAWTDALANGMTETEVAQAFLTSPEYRSAHPDTASLVSGLYHDVLGRDGDAAGLAYWQERAGQAGSWPAVVGAVLTSAEAETRQVDGCYQDYLGRAADPSGEQFYRGGLRQGRLSLADVAETQLASDEFFAQAAKQGGM
jgi:hypothetical protein